MLKVHGIFLIQNATLESCLIYSAKTSVDISLDCRIRNLISETYRNLVSDMHRIKLRTHLGMGEGCHYSLIKTFHLHLINLRVRGKTCMDKACRVLYM